MSPQRALEHLDGLGFVALLVADLAEVIEDLALRHPDVRVEPLEQQSAEGLLRAVEVVRLEREHAQILQDRYRARVDLERHVELAERDVLVAERRERLAQAMVVDGELLGAPRAERRDDPFEHLGRLALPPRGVVRVDELEQELPIAPGEGRGSLEERHRVGRSLPLSNVNLGCAAVELDLLGDMRRQDRRRGHGGSGGHRHRGWGRERFGVGRTDDLGVSDEELGERDPLLRFFEQPPELEANLRVLGVELEGALERRFDALVVVHVPARRGQS
jgi:hypothetical protein